MITEAAADATRLARSSSSISPRIGSDANPPSRNART
jgi:hypothetical protein